MATDRSRDAVARAVALMTRQGGSAHWVQLDAAGMTRGQISTRLISGSWSQPHPLVFRANGSASADEDVWTAWLAVCFGTRATRLRWASVGGRTAAELLRIGPLPTAVDRRPVIYVPYGAAVPRLRGVRIRRVRDWDARSFLTLPGGMRVTARPDTVADLAAGLRRSDLLALVQAQAWEHPGLLVRLEERCGCGHAGSAALRAVVGKVRRGIDSTLHERGLRLVRAAGLPTPDCTRELMPGLGVEDCVIERVGATGPPWGLVIGWSGDVHRVERRKYVHDRFKATTLRRGGWVHFDYGIRDVDEPGPTVGELRREWRRQAALPPGGDGRISA